MSEITRVLLVAADRHARTILAHAIDAVGETRLTVAGSPGEARTLLNAHRYAWSSRRTTVSLRSCRSTSSRSSGPTRRCSSVGTGRTTSCASASAAGTQVADAHIKADGLARELGGALDVSAHPRSGPRREPDDLLDLIATVIAPAGADASPWAETDFKAAADMRPRPWVLANVDAAGITAELSFTGNRPAAPSRTPARIPSGPGVWDRLCRVVRMRTP
jgi:hypothetical protein